DISEGIRPTLSGTTDTVSFGAGLQLSDSTLSYNDSGDLLVSFAGSNDAIRLRGQLFAEPLKTIATFDFNNEADSLSRTQLLQREFV
ncbi:hypothetical protein ABTB06_20020, partial [Acinetobacter baumannii]